MARCLTKLLHAEVLLVSDAALLLASPVDEKAQKSYPSLESELAGLEDVGAGVQC